MESCSFKIDAKLLALVFIGHVALQEVWQVEAAFTALLNGLPRAFCILRASWALPGRPIPTA